MPAKNFGKLQINFQHIKLRKLPPQKSLWTSVNLSMSLGLSPKNRQLRKSWLPPLHAVAAFVPDRAVDRQILFQQAAFQDALHHAKECSFQSLQTKNPRA